MIKKFISYFKKNKNIILLSIFILLFSFVVRVGYSVSHTTFSQDVARDLLIVENYQQKGQILISYGPKASVGDFYLPPFYYQLHLFLSTLSDNMPTIMQWAITLVESFTAVVLFFILKKFFSPTIATVGSLFYVISNYPLIFGTFAWNPNMIPLLSSLALLGFLNYIFDDKKNWLIASIVSVALAFHLHYQSAILIPFVFIIFIWSLNKKKNDFKYWLIGTLLSLLTFAPYLFAEIFNNFENSRVIIKYFTQEHSQYFDRVSKIKYLTEFFPIFIEKVVNGQTFNNYIIGRIIFFLGMIIFSIKAWKEKKIRWLAIYFLCIFIMLRVYKGDKVEYYLSTLYILPSVLLAFLINSKFKIFKITSLILIIFLSFNSGLIIARNKPVNEFRDLKTSIQKIDEFTNKDEVRFIFHNDDYVNIFAYGLKHYSQTKLKKTSLILVDICDSNKGCQWDGVLRCVHSRGYTYSSLLKYNDIGFEKIGNFTTKNKHQVAVAKIEGSNKNSNYKISNRTQTYGSDFILENIIY
jgi:4-amino-4-deoxy-L-arabinose transferase-like glycosyltransferase